MRLAGEVVPDESKGCIRDENRAFGSRPEKLGRDVDHVTNGGERQLFFGAHISDGCKPGVDADVQVSYRQSFMTPLSLKVGGGFTHRL